MMTVAFGRIAANDETGSGLLRERTVPIPDTITPVPGYPRKLVVFKMAASRFWQVRCWMKGRSYRRSTQSQSLRVALAFAKTFYEQLLLQKHVLTGVVHQTPAEAIEPDRVTFGQLAAQMYVAEEARVERGELSRGSLQVRRPPGFE